MHPRALRAPARLQKFARARSARALERGILTINNVHLLFCFDKITKKLQNLLIFEKQDTKFSQNYFLHTRGNWRRGRLEGYTGNWVRNLQ